MTVPECFWLALCMKEAENRIPWDEDLLFESKLLSGLFHDVPLVFFRYTRAVVSPFWLTGWPQRPNMFHFQAFDVGVIKVGLAMSVYRSFAFIRVEKCSYKICIYLWGVWGGVNVFLRACVLVLLFNCFEWCPHEVLTNTTQALCLRTIKNSLGGKTQLHKKAETNHVIDSSSLSMDTRWNSQQEHWSQCGLIEKKRGGAPQS